MANRMMISGTVPEGLLHIQWPVAQQALKQVIDRLGYHDRFGERIDISTDFFDWSKTTDKNKNANVRENRVRAKLNPHVNPSTIKWEGSGTQVDLANGNQIVGNYQGAAIKRLPYNHGNHFADRQYAIFNDDYCDILLREGTVGSSLSLDVKMEFEDEFIATEALSRVYQCFTNGDMINYVDIMYDYPFPENFLSILKYLFKLKKITKDNPKGAYTTEEWYQWLHNYSGGAITYLMNRNRTENKEIVINRNNFQALYLIECSQEAPEILNPKGAAVNFTLTIQFARANKLILEYPIIINNNYVHQSFVPMERQVRAAGPTSMIMWQNPAVTKYWYSQLATDREHPPVMFPFWDPWEVPHKSRIWMSGFKPVLVAAFTLDDPYNEEGITKFDFDTDVEKALGCKLDPIIINEIHSGKNTILDCDGFVNVSVFADDIAVDKKDLDISDGHTLIIKSRFTEPIYRMVVSLNAPTRCIVNGHILSGASFSDTMSAAARSEKSLVIMTPEETQQLIQMEKKERKGELTPEEKVVYSQLKKKQDEEDFGSVPSPYPSDDPESNVDASVKNLKVQRTNKKPTTGRVFNHVTGEANFVQPVVVERVNPVSGKTEKVDLISGAVITDSTIKVSTGAEIKKCGAYVWNKTWVCCASSHRQKG